MNRTNVGDVFSNPATLTQIKTVVTLFGVMGFTLGVTGFVLVNQFATFGSSNPGIGLSALGVPMVIGTVVATLLGHQVGQSLVGEPDEFAFATAGVACMAGNGIMVLIAVVLSSFGSGFVGLDVVRVIAVIVVGSVAAGLAGAGGAFAGITFTDGSAPR